MPINSKQLITHLKTCYLAGILSPVTLLYWSIVHILYIQKPMLSGKAWCWSAHFPWKVQLMILSWIWLALPNLISFAFVSTYHNYFRKSYQNMKLVLLWKPESHSPFFSHKNLLTRENGQFPSSIYSWSIGHILEHEFFSWGRLGSSGSKEKMWIWVILRNFWGCFFFIFLSAKKNL